MQTRSSFGFIVILVALALAGGAIGFRQWQKTITLRTSIELARMEVNELAALRAENERLRARQISAAELERLRSDHEALVRLRAELEAAKRSSSAGGR